MRSGSGERVASDASAWPRPCSASPAGCSPRTSSRSSSPASAACSRAWSSSARRAVGLLGQPALGHREHVAEGDEALLGAVVQVAPDAPALLVGRLDDPHARRRDLGLAGAQGDLVAAALDLRRGAGAEDRQRGALVGVGLQAPARLHADVADLRAGAAAHRHGEVGVQAVAGGEVVVGEARDGALGDAHEVVRRRSASTACPRCGTRSPGAGRRSSWLTASTRARSGGSPSISATKATSAPKACASWRVSERKKASPVTVAVPAATACSRSLRPLAGSSGSA